MRTRSVVLISIFALTLLGPWLNIVSGDNTMSTAIELYDDDYQDGYLCYPDCAAGYGPQDQFDWYKVYLNSGEMLQALLYNNGTPSSVWIDMTIYDASSNSLASVSVGDSAYKSVSYLANTSGYYYIELEAIAGYGGDDSFYRLETRVETNNIAPLADQLVLGQQLDEFVCSRECDSSNNPDRVKDPVDWYKFDVPAGISWGVSTDKGSSQAYVDIEIYEYAQNGTLVQVQHSSEGGSNEQYATAWGNSTNHSTYYMSVTASNSQGYYGAEYNLSLSQGSWYSVKEDSSTDPAAGFTYITIDDVRPGDTIRAHAIRTKVPNDLDVLLYNESEFEVYKDYLKNDYSGTTPSEILTKEDCWVCYIQKDLNDSDVGLTTVSPGRSANRSVDLSWTPTFFLVADYTDYLQDPPWNGVQDISHVFLSLDVTRITRTNQYYTVDFWNSTNSNWQQTLTGSSTIAHVSSPTGGWDASVNETDNLSYTDYRITVRNGSTSGSIVSQSQFRSINIAPIACYDSKGIDNSVAVVHVPITFDASCSSDPDSNYANQGIVSSQWYIDGTEYNSSMITGFFSETGTRSISLKVVDDQGLIRWKNETVTIVNFPIGDYSYTTNVSGSTTVRLDTNYTVNETLTWRPNWADAEVANKVIGVGLAFNFTRTHIGYVDVEIDTSVNSQFVSLNSEIISSSDRYILDLKPEVEFYWYDVENYSDAGSIGFPVPSMHELYVNQTNFTIPGQNHTLYLWDEYKEVYNGTTLVDAYGNSQMVNENITLSAIDLYPLIVHLASSVHPVSGEVAKFIANFVDIEVLLEFGIMLQITMDNGLFMHSTTIGDFGDYNSTDSLVQYTGLQSNAYDLYSDSNSTGDVLNTTNLTGSVAFSLYPFFLWESDTDVYGTVNLTINIAPKDWILSILSWFMEDPDSLSQSWSYRLFESSSPIAASGNSGYVIMDTKIDVVLPNHDTDSLWDGIDDDDDNDGVSDSLDNCSQGTLGWISSSATDYDSDGCQDSGEDMDDDNDGIEDTLDTCQTGYMGWTSNMANDYDSDGCYDLSEDTDDDNDQVLDAIDSCALGYLNWVSTTATDHDGDGCQDGIEDLDDDNDGIVDTSDTCPLGVINWISSASSDYDGDGCQDISEDSDDDNDNVMDNYDDCSNGIVNWTSDSATDYDSDGCQDSSEDMDDDNDQIVDVDDLCAKGDISWSSDSTNDYDSDGCRDLTEDTDDDNDQIADTMDSCAKGELSWSSDSSTDYDSDGCQDSSEDSDDDNDQVDDNLDSCMKGEMSWTSNSATDYDSDGCQDSSEDTDDDNDQVGDISDACSKGDLSWFSDSNTDFDSDGCQDSLEDTDDDNDQVTDTLDACAKGDLNWFSDSTTDYDGDGCQDSLEDDDDDNDQILDATDSCVKGDLSWSSDSTTDYDSDGCQDSAEDLDDDNDQIIDSLDACSKGDLDWSSDSATDYDSDGCQDSAEDMDDDNDLVMDSSDACMKGDLSWSSDSFSDYDSDGCQDSAEDMDDDNDLVADEIDDCMKGELGWSSDSTTDYDSDGCQDSGEDLDDDNDLIIDTNDGCEKGEMNWISASSTDYDSDGCQDSGEDLDDDNDLLSDDLDSCSMGEMDWISDSDTDYDSDGCQDSSEDLDDDNDLVLDLEDAFPLNASYSLDDDSDGVANELDAFPDNPDQSSDKDGDGFGDNSDGKNGDACPDSSNPETTDGCPWTVTSWMGANPTASIGMSLGVVSLVAIAVVIFRRRNFAGTDSKSELLPILPATSMPVSTAPSPEQKADMTDQNGYEWINQQNGEKWYRVANSNSAWTKFE